MPDQAPAQPRPSLVSWNLTRRCNLRCPHCYLSAGKGSKDELSTEECLELVDELADLGTEMVILTGGEPLLRKDIYDLASACSQAGMWVVMGSNGVLLTDEAATRMVECGVKGVGISIDSLDPELHDGFRGGPDAWRQSVRGLEVCREHGLETLVQTTVMEMNYEEIPRILDFARDKGAWSCNLYFLVQTGRGQRMNDLSAVRTEEMLTRLAELQSSYRPMLVRAKCAPHFKRIAYEQGLAGLDSGGCMAGTEYCRITPEGDVTPCPYMTEIAGNVRRRGFGDIWRHSALLNDLRDPDRLGGRCGACEYRQLCGGCRCRAYAATGDVLAEDPACSYDPAGRSVNAPIDLSEIVWSDPARARLERIPIAFIRRKVGQGVEAYARANDLTTITLEVMDRGIQGSGRSTPSWATRSP